MEAQSISKTQSVSTDQALELPLPGAAESRTLAADPPVTSPRQRQTPFWVSIAFDFLSASVGLVAIALLVGGSPSAVAIVAPALLVYFNWSIGFYGPREARPGAAGRPRPALALLLTTGLFALSAGILEHTSLGGTGGIGPLEQLVVWIGVFASTLVSRGTPRNAVQHVEPERWLVVGDAGLVARLEDALGGPESARIVGAEPIPANRVAPLEDRFAALAAVKRTRANRVVLPLSDVDSGTALGLVHTFKALGVPVSLLEPPPDLVESLPHAERSVGGVPVVDVGQLTRNGDARRNGNGASNGNGLPPGHGSHNGDAAQIDAIAPRVSVIIPTLNEADNLPHVLKRLPPDLHEVILVDGSSSDQTVEVAMQELPDIRVVTQTGRGKGDALRAGFAAVTGDIIVTLDADGSADPAEIPRFVECLRAGSDFAKGSRFLGDGGSDDITPIRELGNWALNTTANVLYGTSHTDLCYGFNAFWTRCLPYISADASGFEVETLMTLRSAKAGLKVSEVPSFEARRLHGQSNLKIFRDGFRVLRTIVRERVVS